MGQVTRWIVGFALSGLMAACAQPRPGEAVLPEDAQVTHRAVFIGKEHHDTRGTISLYQSRQYPVIVFEPNFEASDAENTVVALGRDGYDGDTSLGSLLRNTGRQAYAVPGELPVGQYNEVWLWNESKNIPLGLARLVPI